MNETILRSMVDLRDRTLQKSRIAFGNRMDAIMRGEDKQSNGSYELLERWYSRMLDLEEKATKDIEKACEGVEIIEEMTKIRGIGKILAAKAVSMIDIHRADTISALWRYAGYGVVDGKAEKPTKGEKIHYNKRLKSVCYLIGESFLRSRSPYRSIYDRARLKYETREDWNRLRQHRAAMRKMIKTWLAHLWLRWREIEGLPTKGLYAMEYLEHSHYLTAEEFGWGRDEPMEGKIELMHEG